MATRPFRFVQAGDLHLELVPQGVGEIPKHLRETFRDAPYRAARRLFDITLNEEADFLLLTGDVVHVQAAGLRALLFLLEQFHRLAEQNIPVYWVGGTIDPPELWPADFPLPENVHRFPSGHLGQYNFPATDPVVQIVGRNATAQTPLRSLHFAHRHQELFTLAVANGEFTEQELSTHVMDYWALGGKHQLQEMLSGHPQAWYSGSTQGRNPDEGDAHGCLVVDVAADGEVRQRLVPTDRLRYTTWPLTVSAATSPEELQQALHTALKRLSRDAEKVDWLVFWLVSGDGPLITQLRRGSLAGQLLEKLRIDFGCERPALWSVQIDCEPHARLTPERFAEPTILGDYLRQVGEHCEEHTKADMIQDENHQESSAEPVVLDLETMLGTPVDRERPTLSWHQPKQQQRVLREAAALGLDWLGGEEAET